MVGNQVCMFGECAVSEDTEPCLQALPLLTLGSHLSVVPHLYPLWKKKKTKKIIVSTSLDCVLGVILVNHQTWGNSRGPESVARWSEVEVGTSLVVQ